MRESHPEIAFLVPGIGAQGGDLEAMLAAGLDAEKQGLIVSSSRAIVFAGDSAAIRAAAKKLRDEINAFRR